MSTLLIDIGNTRIKWARFDGRRMGAQKAASHSSWGAQDFERQLLGSPQEVTGILVSSVASASYTELLTEAAARAGLARPKLAATQRRAGGVTVGYLEPWRLGVDRFVGAIGAHDLFSGQALCVIGVGTAMTVDLINARGRHLGGAIIPGPELMVETLLNRTNGIRRRAQGGDTGSSAGLFGRSTRAGIMQGSRYAAAATIERALEEGAKRLKEEPLAVLTGGGVANLRALVRKPARVVPDLVLRGLAVLAREDSQ